MKNRDIVMFSGLLVAWMVVQVYFYFRFGIFFIGPSFIPIVAVFGLIVAVRRKNKKHNDEKPKPDQNPTSQP